MSRLIYYRIVINMYILVNCDMWDNYIHFLPDVEINYIWFLSICIISFMIISCMVTMYNLIFYGGFSKLLVILYKEGFLVCVSVDEMNITGYETWKTIYQ